MDGGCLVPISHAIKKPGGYFQKIWRIGGRDIREYFHRFIYRASNSLEVIPEGYEVDHTCRNRACQNPEHLQLLKKVDHASITRKRIAYPRIEVAQRYWRENRCTGTTLAKIFDVDISTACLWIRQAKAALA